jgi:hypothetical protein
MSTSASSPATIAPEALSAAGPYTCPAFAFAQWISSITLSPAIKRTLPEEFLSDKPVWAERNVFSSPEARIADLWNMILSLIEAKILQYPRTNYRY